MLGERWQEVKQILSTALELEASRRSAFIAKACSGDASLIREIESLIEAYQQHESFLERPAAASAGIGPGARLGIYQVEELIGAGGMGEVYRAIDTTLGLAVAIKVLPPVSSSDPQRLWRFEQEARAAAILHHPNILYVHQLGTHEGQPYIVSELLEGKTLRARMKEGPLSPPEILDYAAQIADGLAVAHEKGIVHRDLKPENLFVTRYGQIKILDFGLAKAVEGIGLPGARHDNSDPFHTATGTTLGTTSYMSPEQLRGQNVGPASDIFSLGVVLYEIVTGARPFQGDTAAMICDGILNRAPVSPRTLNPDISRGLELIIERAIKKDPGQRYPHASEFRAELLGLRLTSGTGILDAASHRKLDARFYAASFSSGLLKWARLGLAAVALLCIPIALIMRHRTAPPGLTGKSTIVLADFRNTTGEPVFDDALQQGLEVDLQQSTFLNILSDEKIRTQLRYMGRSGEERLSPDLAREVCRREGAGAVLFSSIANLGSHYVITLKALDCQSTDVLDEEQGESDRREKVLTGLHRLGTRLRAKLGESLSSIEHHDTPLEQATTPNLDALQAFSSASRTFRTQGEMASLPLYKRAIELDPNFALAYADLGVIYANLNENELSTECARRAYQLRDKVTEWERFSIDSTYYRSVTGELEKAAQVNAAWKKTYPRELAPYVNAGVIDSYLGQLERALSDDLEGVRVSPDTAAIYSNLASDYLALGNLDDAERVLKETDNLRMGTSMTADRYQLAFLRNDEKSMSRLVDESIGKPGIEDSLLASQSDTEASYGRLARARELSRRAVESAVRADAKETAATWEADAALREAEFGNAAQTRRDVAVTLSLAATREVRIAAAIALARIGDITRARSMAADLGKRFPDDTLLQNYWLPSIRAAIALQQKRGNLALEELRVTSPYELGGGTPPFLSGATMYPVYLRGEAYLKSGQWASALAEFQKISDHRGLVWNFPVGAFAKLELARAYAGSADKVRARQCYQQLLNSWSNADSDVYVYRIAKAEFAKLN